MKENNIEIKNDRDHLLLIPEMYIGSMSESQIEDYFLENDKFIIKKINYIPALLKIISEIIDNSIDESIRTDFNFSNKISIEITDTSIKVSDNGRGIPVKKISDSELYMPEAAFTLARSGSNFKNKDTKKEIGTHGIGSFATNVFSKIFEVTTQDSKNKFHMICKNNNDGNHKIKISESSKNGTEVYFEPDLNRFNISKIDQSYKEIVKQRLIFLSLSYPKIKFTFNDEKIKSLSENNFISMFNEDFEIFKNEKFFFSILPSQTDNFNFFTYVNGLYMNQGGAHIDLISSEIVSRIREKISKKFPQIKPGDIKNKLQLIVFFNEFNNPKFNSQTKEILTNSYSEIKNYLGDIDWDSFCAKIYKNEKIIEPIIEIYKIKEEFKKRQDLKSLAGNKKRNVEKYLPPIENQKYLALVEGDCLNENTEICIITEEGISVNKQLKNISIGEYVYTDRHSLKRIVDKNTSIRKECLIKTKNNQIISCSEIHRLYVYDTFQKKFLYKQINEINKETDKLISSKLSKIKFIDEIVSIEKIEENKFNYLIKYESGETRVTSNHKFLVFIPNQLQFINLCAHSLEKGYFLCFIEGDSI